jgi:CHAD domain-containing protein
MREYARRQAAILLGKLELEIGRPARSGGAERIHDLRVAIRRFSRCLRCFAQLYPGRRQKKVRARLAVLRDLAGAVRDRDIALELLARAGVAERSALVTGIHAERVKASHQLAREIARWRDRGFMKKWRGELGL